MAMKKRISSMGKLRTLSPIRYFSLNPQTPNSVKMESHTRKKKAGKTNAGSNARQFSANRILRSNEQATGIATEQRLISR